MIIRNKFNNKPKVTIPLEDESFTTTPAIIPMADILRPKVMVPSKVSRFYCYIYYIYELTH